MSTSTEHLIRKCCQCQRIEHQGAWCLETTANAEAVYTHTFCPACFKLTMAQLVSHSAKRLTRYPQTG